MRARVATLIGVAVGVAVAIVAAGWRGERTVQRARTTLSHAEGLREGARVTYRGVEVGTVKRLTFESTGIGAELHLHREVPIRMADSVALRTMGLLGDRVLDIAPGPSTAPLLPDNGFLPSRGARPDMSPEEWLKRLQPPPETVYRDSGGRARRP
jgi:phospholipid/cholesterol/gamma-HCH transport system substrate-binding protein